MTWKELEKYISEMTDEEKNGKVKYVDPYDDYQVQHCELDFASSDMRDQTGDAIQEGEWFLR